MQKRVLLISNPIAGDRKTDLLSRWFVRTLEQSGHEVETFVTASADDIHHRVRRLEPEGERLVVAGGDGTINQVLNGLRDPALIPLFILPTGTANVLANELGLPRSLGAAVQIFEQAHIRHLDMGLVGKRRFLSMLSAGVDAMVTQELIGGKGRIRGYWRYVFPFLKVILRYKPPRLQVQVDSSDRLAGSHVLVSNVRRYGSGLKFAHRAYCDSGHFDVCIFPKRSFFSLCRYYLVALLGKPSWQTGVIYLTGRRIRIDSTDRVPVQIDGDYLGTTPVEVELRPSLVPIIVPDPSRMSRKTPGQTTLIEP
ncbi:MAG: diacylglycerol kinase family lipid kinase [Deltaproteobacteria bacterium]|nr:MAG: diacylglycerol kinase family lipid kinase [Deltaproteobacteria bacterium]